MSASSHHIPTQNQSFFLDRLNAIEDHVSTCKSCPHPPLNQFVFGEGSTPLLLACHFGKLVSVKHMIESWQVDVQASSTYYLHPTSLTNFTAIEKASPLFVAAYRGHSRVVRYLLEQSWSRYIRQNIERKECYI